MSGRRPSVWAWGSGGAWSQPPLRTTGCVYHQKVEKLLVTFLANLSLSEEVSSLYCVQMESKIFNFLLQKGEVQFIMSCVFFQSVFCIFGI